MSSTDQRVIFTHDELDLIAEFAAGCSLDEKPGSNWVQDAGGLPDYICRIARAVKKTGKSTSQAISIAVSRVKMWSTGVGVNTDTQTKAAAAVAEWEKLKGKAHAKKKTSGVLAATNTARHDTLVLTDYNVDIVRQAFSDRTRAARADWRAKNPNADYDAADSPPYLWVKEQWTSFLIVQSDHGSDPTMFKVPYTVDDKLTVTFEAPVQVQTQYVVVDGGDLTGSDLTDADLQKLLELTPPCGRSKVDKFLTLSASAGALDRVVGLAAMGKSDTATA